MEYILVESQSLLFTKFGYHSMSWTIPFFFFFCNHYFLKLKLILYLFSWNNQEENKNKWLPLPDLHWFTVFTRPVTKLLYTALNFCWWKGTVYWSISIYVATGEIDWSIPIYVAWLVHPYLCCHWGDWPSVTTLYMIIHVDCRFTLLYSIEYGKGLCSRNNWYRMSL